MAQYRYEIGVGGSNQGSFHLSSAGTLSGSLSILSPFQNVRTVSDVPT